MKNREHKGYMSWELLSDYYEASKLMLDALGFKKITDSFWKKDLVLVHIILSANDGLKVSINNGDGFNKGFCIERHPDGH